MSDNEKLIDEAREMLKRPDGADLVFHDELIVRDITDALEAAERELRTLRNTAKDYDTNFPCDGGCNTNDGPEETCSRHGRSPRDLWNLLDAARRTEVPEPSAPGEHGGTIPLYGMLDVWMALYGTSHPEFDAFYAEHGYADTWARILAAVRQRHAEPQSEPSDASVQAFVRGFYPLHPTATLADWSDDFIDRVRAGLRAAGGVR